MDLTEGNEGNEEETQAFKGFILPIGSENLETSFVDPPLLGFFINDIDGQAGGQKQRPGGGAGAAQVPQ